MSRRYGMIDDKFAHDIAGHPVLAKLAIYDVILFLGEKYFLPLTFSANKHLVVGFDCWFKAYARDITICNRTAYEFISL